MKLGDQIKIIIITSLILLINIVNISSQELSDTSIVFNKILLTDEGIIAVDTNGNKWHYDFDEDQFIEGTGLVDSDDNPIEKRCTEKKYVNPLDRSISIGANQYVDGDIIVYGKVTVNGWVKGSVKSLNGKVLVTGSGRVDGNVEAPDIVIRDGGEVLGELVITDISIGFDEIKQSFDIDGIIIVISLMFFVFFVGFLLLALIPQKINIFNQCFYENKLKTTLIGFVSLFLMPLVFALVIITIIGIALTPLIPLIYLIAMIMGIVAFSNKLGKTISSKFVNSTGNIFFTTFIGLTLITSGWILTAILLGMDSGVSTGFGIFTLVLMILISAYPICSGLGAAVLTRFGFKPYKKLQDRQPSVKPSAPAPPPMPKLKNGMNDSNPSLVPPEIESPYKKEDNSNNN
jgi:hypothetical protein